MPQVIRYRFSQSFPVSAQEAFCWCTDYSSGDPALMGEVNAEREVSHLTDSTLILNEVFHTADGDVEKQKLIQLYPERFSWVSTHLSGPSKYSQFIYEISPEGEHVSRLNFTALHIEHKKETMPPKEVNLLADKLCKYDSNIWKLLASAMTKDLCK